MEIGLTRIFGIGRPTSKKILAEAAVNPNIRVNDLNNEDIAKIRGIIDRDIKVEGDLRKEVTTSIKRLTDIGCYRGIRHKSGLPVRGQRTKTNARTRRGPSKGVVKKKGGK
ncbi:Ribosomal protein S13, bacterial-type [Candidatus Magnetobacterium bavaricum]|uniref:Small ribosomal subunit protein uS13 n=1 Tax=Candidatus Magnetobacterium bavaricum TaxID=29290 RepID=A0A0F3GHW8_9BACT|nr:Ribosomal protein S13, bacterial-type [Candidatus Magnetobacterium bavaricum]